MTNHAHELELVTSTPRTSSASAALSAHLTTYSSTATPSNQPAPPLASPTTAVHFSPKTPFSTRRKGAEKLLNFLNDALASHKPARLPEFVKHLKDHIRVPARQTKVDQVIAGWLVGLGVSLGPYLEIPTPIYLGDDTFLGASRTDQT